MKMFEPWRGTLWLAIEDYSGLWEVVWELNTARPDTPNDLNRSTAREAVEYLLKRGWIQIYTTREPDGEPIAATAEAAEKLMNTPSAWEPPSTGGIAVRIGATKEGEEAYQSEA